jgi:anti-sigma factor RsiW
MNQRDDFCDELISAFLDGEVSPDERARVEQLVASSEEHRQSLEDMQAVTRGIQRLPGYSMDGEFSQRVIAIARQTSGMSHEVDAARSVRFTPAATVWYWPAVVGLTATAAAALLLAFSVWNMGMDSIDSSGSQTVAQVPDTPAVSMPGEPTATDDSPLVAASVRGILGPSAMRPMVDNQPPSSDARSTSAAVAQMDLTPPGQPTIPSDSASTGEVASPAPTMVAAESVTSRSLPAQPRVRDSAASDDGERLPEELLNGVPFSGTQQLLLVIDVAMTQQGAERGAFERALAAHGIAVEGTVPVDSKLEESLLTSRFFEPIRTPPGSEQVARTDMALVYVSTRAGHVDEIWRGMQSNAGEFAAISLDMAFLPNDQALFQKLQQAVEPRAADAPPVAEAKLRERRAAAHRLALSPSWRGTPAQKLKGVEGLSGMVPDWMLDGDAAKTPPFKRVSGQPLSQVPLASGGRLGENVDAEVLFVVHVGRGMQD